jgi:hypothetical protein
MNNSQSFVTQQYRDFFNREPDAAGLQSWTNEIEKCGENELCREESRIQVSTAFFRSTEFWEVGYLVYRFYKVAFSNLPGAPVPVRFQQLFSDTQRINRGVVVGVGDWQMQLEANKQAFALEFVQRREFASAFPSMMTAEQFVDKLFSSASVTPTTAERQAAVNAFGAGDTAGRAAALRSAAESQSVHQSEFNRASVLMHYFGYLRRDPDAAPDTNFSGLDFWLGKLEQFGGDPVRAEIFKTFINSEEYRARLSCQQ